MTLIAQDKEFHRTAEEAETFGLPGPITSKFILTNRILMGSFLSSSSLLIHISLPARMEIFLPLLLHVVQGCTV